MSGRGLALLLLVACGDGDKPLLPDAASVGELAPECHTVGQDGPDPFLTAADLGPVIPGSLAGWDPTGRWFLTGVRVGGVSSFNFKLVGGVVIVDNDYGQPGSLDADVLFQRSQYTVDGEPYLLVKRVSNRMPDGTLRAERVLCDGAMCRVCTAKLERATRNDSEGESDHFSLLGEIGGDWPPVYTLNVRVAGTIAYVVRRDGLYIVETADPANPVLLGHYTRPSNSGSANDVKIVDTGTKRYALIADVPVDVVDVTDPAAPQLAAVIAEEAHTVAIESRDGKTYAYFGNYDMKCPIYDVTDPALPVKLGSYTTPGRLVHDLSVETGIAYLNAWDAGFLVVDYTTPATPQLLGTWTPTTAGSSHSSWPTTVAGRHVALHGDENYNAHLDVVDVDPASATFMKPIGSYKTRDQVSIHNIMAFGAKGYFTYYQDGVRVVDLSDPTAPKLVGYFNTWDPQGVSSTSQFFEGAVGLDVDQGRGLVFVADSPRGLLILQDSTP